MATLHILSSPQSLNRAAAIFENLKPDDSILLRADALYLLLDKKAALPSLCLGLLDDAQARGINHALFSGIEWIDYSQWVAQVTAHARTINW